MLSPSDGDEASVISGFCGNRRAVASATSGAANGWTIAVAARSIAARLIAGLITGTRSSGRPPDPWVHLKFEDLRISGFEDFKSKSSNPEILKS
jgi:hypothetical protein